MLLNVSMVTGSTWGLRDTAGQLEGSLPQQS